MKIRHEFTVNRRGGIFGMFFYSEIYLLLPIRFDAVAGQSNF